MGIFADAKMPIVLATKLVSWVGKITDFADLFIPHLGEGLNEKLL